MRKRIIYFMLVASILLTVSSPVSALDLKTNAQSTTTVSANFVGFTQAQKDRLQRVIDAQSTDMNRAFNADIEPVSAKPLLDFAGNQYTVIECEPTGYMIFHNASCHFVEFSTSSPSPYLYYSDNLFYGGPTEYYYFDGEQYLHTVIAEHYNDTLAEDMATTCEIANQYYVDTADRDVIDYVTRGVVSDQVRTISTNSSLSRSSFPTYISNAPVFTHCTTQSEMSYFNKGACGYIAAALLMLWYRQSVNINYLTTNSSTGLSYVTYKSGYYVFNGTPSTYYDGRTFSYNLWRWHSTMGNADYTNGNYSTGAGDIATTLSSYLSTKNISCNYIPALLPSTSYVISILENKDRPYLLWGYLQPADESRDKCMHAVTVYGHYNGYLLCHFGWEGYTCSSVDGIWGSGLYLNQ